jgi:hypothetical protein
VPGRGRVSFGWQGHHSVQTGCSATKLRVQFLAEAFFWGVGVWERGVTVHTGSSAITLGVK